MSYDNNNTGALFANKNRATDKHPTHTGSCEIDRTQYFIDAWVNESKAGQRYFKLKFKPKMASEHKGAPANPPAQSAPRQMDEFDDSDIPF